MTPYRLFSTSCLAVALAMAAFGPMVGAQASVPHDHDRARQALEAGEILPLHSVLEQIEKSYPGQIMEVELERENGAWEYEIKILRPGGILLKLKVDARDGTLLKSKQRNAGTERRHPNGE